MSLRLVDRWISGLRLLAVVLAIFQVAVSNDYPPGYERWAWAITIVFTVGAIVLFALSRRDLTDRGVAVLSVVAQLFDTAVVSGYVLVFSYEVDTPTRQTLYLPLIEACVRYAVPGGIAVVLVSIPVLTVFERLRSHDTHRSFRYDYVTLQAGLELLMALTVGWLVRRLVTESREARERAVEAEGLRDELGRRADLVDAANRCARALASSLESDEAFGAFIRELRILIPFERVAIVLAENGQAQVVATAGTGSENVFPAGSGEPLQGTVLEDALTASQPIYRPSLDGTRYPEERAFRELGLRSRLVAPLLTGARAIGMLSLLRREEDSFTEAEIELAGILGRLVASAAQNLRSYEVERRTVDELRRVSGLRADFLSVVSHELRTPMAAVMGAARTLQVRWRDLADDQREQFLALIADETGRLAALVSDVLDTSRIDAGSFSYSFAPVDLAAIVEDAVSTASLWQADVDVVAQVPRALPVLEGDASRLRQVVSNLIDNAVKYSPPGEAVTVRATALADTVVVDITDKGPGIAPVDQQLIFEKFGRVRGSSKPGSGLGLYIARAIVEAHGGALDVASTPGLGATFTISLPVDRSDGAPAPAPSPAR